MPDFETQLTELLKPIFTDLGLDASLAKVRPSARPDLGDFQCNGALAGAKLLGANPRELAQQIVDRINSLDNTKPA